MEKASEHSGNPKSESGREVVKDHLGSVGGYLVKVLKVN